MRSGIKTLTCVLFYSLLYSSLYSLFYGNYGCECKSCQYFYQVICLKANSIKSIEGQPLSVLPLLVNIPAGNGFDSLSAYYELGAENTGEALKVFHVAFGSTGFAEETIAFSNGLLYGPAFNCVTGEYMDLSGNNIEDGSSMNINGSVCAVTVRGPF